MFKEYIYTLNINKTLIDVYLINLDLLNKFRLL
jgi:hypothetical protein